MRKSEKKDEKPDYTLLPRLDYLYDEDMYDYPLGCCLAISVRLLTDPDDMKMYFDFGDEA